MPSKCRRTSAHCRKIKSDGNAKYPCTRDGKLGTRVRAHYSPKSCNAQATRIQALIRGRLSRSKSKSKSSAASRIQALIRGRLSRKKSAPASTIPFADSIKAGHAKVRVGEKFKTASGTYVKTASKPSGFKKV